MMGVEPASMRASVRSHSDMNIPATSRPIAIKFYLFHRLGRGKAALGFGPADLWFQWQQIGPIGL